MSQKRRSHRRRPSHGGLSGSSRIPFPVRSKVSLLLPMRENLILFGEHDAVQAAKRSVVCWGEQHLAPSDAGSMPSFSGHLNVFFFIVHPKDFCDYNDLPALSPCEPASAAPERLVCSSRDWTSRTGHGVRPSLQSCRVCIRSLEAFSSRRPGGSRQGSRPSWLPLRGGLARSIGRPGLLGSS